MKCKRMLQTTYKELRMSIFSTCNLSLELTQLLIIKANINKNFNTPETKQETLRYLKQPLKILFISPHEKMKIFLAMNQH